MVYEFHRKSEIKNSFLTFFKVQDVTHLVAQKLKEIKQRRGESVREYDEIQRSFEPNTDHDRSKFVSTMVCS